MWEMDLREKKSVDQLERGKNKNAHFWSRPPFLHHQPCWHYLNFTPYILCTWPIALPFDFSFLTLLPCFVTYTPFLLNLFFLPIHSSMKCWQFMCPLYVHPSMWKMTMPPRIEVILTFSPHKSVTSPFSLGSLGSCSPIVHARGYCICCRDPALFDKLLYNNYIYPLGRAEK